MRILSIIFFFFLKVATPLLAQDTMQSVVIHKIYLAGNKRTHDKVILREMDIHEGDTLDLAQTDTLFKINKNRIYNTRLFNEIKLTLLPADSGKRNLLVEVQERWYIWPVPIFELADRSFNEWWYNQHHDFRRVNYGIRFTDKNFRGRKEELKLAFQGGFTSKINMAYTVPYLNRKQTLGLDFNFNYDQNKQVTYRTFENKQLFIKKENLLRERYAVGMSLFYRKSFFGTHFMEVGYNYNKVADTIAVLNPLYFGGARRKQQYAYLRYEFSYDKRDVRAYALKGYYASLSYEQNGFTGLDDVHYGNVTAAWSGYKPLGHGFYLASLSKIKAYVGNEIPYSNIRAMGYDQDYVRGYDLYVIDARYFGLQRTTLRKKLIENELNVRRIIPMDQFSNVPFTIYLNAYYDLGYTYSPVLFPGNELLANDFLRGGGLGVDVVTYYDSVIRFEYSVNKLLEHRIFLAFTKDI